MSEKNNGIESRLGKCYKLASQYVMNNEGWILVQGYIYEDVRRKKWNDANTHERACINHAWCERTVPINERHSEIFVYDAVFDMTYTRDAYYRLYGAEPIVSFDKEAMCEKLVQTGMYQAWHEIDRSKIKLLNTDEL